MGYSISKENNLGVIRNHTSGELIVSGDKATINVSGAYGASTSVSITLSFVNYVFGFNINALDSINGSTPPTDIEQLVFLLAQIFSGNTVTVIIN